MARVLPYVPKRRGRESSDPWRELARTAATGTLLRVTTSDCAGVRKRLKSTHRWLSGISVADLLRWLDTGVPVGAPRGRSVGASHRKVKRLVALHDAAGHVLALCAARLGLRQGWGGAGADADAGARWQACEKRRDEAARHAAEALRRLRSALADLTATVNVLLVVSPSGSPAREAWASEAYRLVRHAKREVAAARRAMERMRRAVALEFFGAWAVLSR